MHKMKEEVIPRILARKCRILYGEACFYQGMLIQCQTYHANYACSYGGVAMSGGDGMDSSTQVPVVRHAWAPVATSCRARH
jgi:hypothetical protein